MATVLGLVMEIRPARVSDAEATVDVVRRSITELCVDDHKNDAATMAKWLQNKRPEIFATWIENANNFCVVAVDKERIYGAAIVNRGGGISLFYLAPGALRQGIGTALHEALERKARSWDLKKLQLGSTLGARRFYESLGYVSTGPAVLRFGVLYEYPYEKLVQTTAAT